MSAYDTYGIAWIPLRFGKGKRFAQRAEPTINARIFYPGWAAEKRKTLLLLLFIVDVLGSSTRSACEGEAATHVEWAGRSFSSVATPWAYFYMLKGSPTVANSSTRGVKLLQCLMITTDVFGQMHLVLCLGVPYFLGDGKRTHPISTA